MAYTINGIVIENFKILGYVPEWLQKKANSIARKHGYLRADNIVIGMRREIATRTDYGWRKYTTGEYVPNAYRRNFGWKNTYYQHSSTTVSLLPEDLQK